MLIQMRFMPLILIDISRFFNLPPFLAAEQLLEPLRESPEVLGFRKSADKMDNLEKVLYPFSHGR